MSLFAEDVVELGAPVAMAARCGGNGKFAASQRGRGRQRVVAMADREGGLEFGVRFAAVEVTRL